VITRQLDWSADGVEIAHSITEALDLAAQTPEKTCYIGGGSEIYQAAWPYLTELDITQVHGNYAGSATFPIITPNQWVEVSRVVGKEFDFVSYLPNL
ncbi:MAG: diacylglycerol kinase, partial [Propionibacterium sp.]